MRLSFARNGDKRALAVRVVWDPVHIPLPHNRVLLRSKNWDSLSDKEQEPRRLPSAEQPTRGYRGDKHPWDRDTGTPSLTDLFREPSTGGKGLGWIPGSSTAEPGELWLEQELGGAGRWG